MWHRVPGPADQKDGENPVATPVESLDEPLPGHDKDVKMVPLRWEGPPGSSIVITPIHGTQPGTVRSPMDLILLEPSAWKPWQWHIV